MRRSRDMPLPGLEDQRRGWRGPAVCRAVGITYRQLDYWDTTGLVSPSIRQATGSGTQRLYGLDDVVTLRVVKRLLDTGVSLQRIRHVIDYVQDRGLALRRLTVASDGDGVFVIFDVRELARVLAAGRGVFAIAVESLYDETERVMSRLPSEPAYAHALYPTTEDDDG
jgi:DNA-binding transcriptional MerR regulator